MEKHIKLLIIVIFYVMSISAGNLLFSR